MRAPSRTGPRWAELFGASARLWFVLAFFAALNAAGVWWIRESVRPHRSGPRVLSVTPTGEASTRSRIVVTFSRDVVPADPAKQPDPAAMVRLVPAEGGSVPGAARWASVQQLVFEPAQPLAHARDHWIVLSPEIGRPGAPLEGPTWFAFRTEPLDLLQASQVKLARGGFHSIPSEAGPGEAVIRLGFSAAVRPDHLPSHLRVLAPNDTALPYTVLADEPSKEIDIRCAAPATKLKVTLGPAIHGRADFLGLRAEKSLEVDLTYILRVTEARGTRVSLERPSLEVYFNNPVSLEGNARLEDSFALDPPLAFTAVADWSRVALDAEFQPGARYRLTVKKGLEGSAGSRLVNDVTRDVVFPDREPSLTFDGDGTFLSSQGNLSLLLKSVNVRAVSVQALRVLPNNLVHALDIRWPRTSFVRTLPARIYHPAPGPNQIRELPIDLHDVIGADPRGVWYIEASSGPDEAERVESAERLVSVSDIGITVKSASHGAWMIWTVSLRTGEPLTGVGVSIRSQSNQLIAEATTGDGGIAMFEHLPDDDGPPHLVLAAKDGDLAYLEIAKRGLPESDFDTGGRPYLESGLEAFLFTDRGVYRPGEIVRLRALVRARSAALPGEFPIELETLRPDGKRFRAEKILLGAEGSAGASIPIGPSSSTGLYRVRLRLPGGKPDDPELGSVSFRVEEYMPSRLRVEMSAGNAGGAAEPRRLRPGEPFEIVVKGTHLFGLPASGCKVEASWRLEAVPFEPKDWKAFRFCELAPKELHWSRSGDATSDSGTLDASGEARFHLEVPRVETASALVLRCTARVLDVGGRAVTGELDVPVDPAPIYIGLRAADADGGSRRVAADQAARFECIAVHADGSPAGLEAADLIVQTVRWSSVLKKISGGRYAYESREEVNEVARRRVVFASGRGAFEHTFGAPGSYRLRVKDPASLAAAEVSVYVAGPGASFSSVSMEKPERLDLSFTSAACPPGGTAHLVVRSPFAGTLLVTTETVAVQSARVIHMTDASAQVDIPVPEGAAGTIYASASVVRGIDPDAEWVPHRAYGIAPIPIDWTSKRLVVTLAAPDEVRPRAHCTVRAEVAEENGDPVRGAEVLIALVDEGILALTRESVPDPFGFFFGQRAHGVESADSFTSLVEEVPLAKARSRPGGDSQKGGAPEARRLDPIQAERVKSAVIWSGPLTTSEDGGVVAEFELPPFTGELRFFAVASAGDRFGSSRRSVIVRGPFFFEMSLPRFLAPGDAFTVPVMAFNRTAEGGKATFNWSLDGIQAGLKPPGDDLAFAASSEAAVDVPARASARSTFALRADERCGKATVRLDAKLGDESHSESIELPVRPAAPRVELTDAGAVTADKPLELIASKSFLDGTSRWRLVLSSFPDVELAGSLRYLLEYPHGCIEQTTSRAFALLYMKELAEAVGAGGAGDYSAPADPGAGKLGNVEAYVLAGIDRVLEMQSYGGWFGAWPESRQPWPWASLYATHFLLEARAAGYPVPEPEVRLALRYIEDDIVKARRRESRADLLERAYGLYVLALARTPDAGSMDRLREETLAALKAPARSAPRSSAASSTVTDAATDAVTVGEAAVGEFPPSVRFLLGSAYLLAGNGDAARSLIGGELPPAGERRETGGTLRSPAREAAILLSTLVDVDASDPRLPSLLERLRSCREQGRWTTTQDNAFALLALGKYARSRTNAPSDFRGSVVVGGQPAAQIGPGERRVFRGETLEGGVRVSIEGSGQLFYWWSEEGVPADGKAEEADHGMKVRRRLLDRNLAPLDPKAIPFGDAVIVELSIEASPAVHNVAVTDMLPAGLEAENPRLGGAEGDAGGRDALVPAHVSVRDDRVIAFFDLVSKGVYRYAARAVTRGEFALPPVEAEALYEPETRSIAGAGKVIVR